MKADTPPSATVAPFLRNRFLATLATADRAAIEPNVKTGRFEQGKILYEQGGDIDQAYFPLTGMISIVALLKDGDKAVEVATIGNEGAAGTVTGFGPSHAFNRAIVQVSGLMSWLDARHLEAAVQRSNALRNHIVRYNELVTAQIQQSVACNALHTVQARLSRWLLQTHERIDSNIIPLTQEFLSEMLGVRRSTVTEIASELQARELIRYRRGKIEILDAGRLKEAACECYETVRRRTNKYFPLAGDVQ
ncbi:MAG TPA: Crp/Fnr family transcriptional regulator [Xanthobacteraceae bacterium]|nr:Crp/Fnr family transcriptional regulator [Xanthobacteraceae bacterium]